MCVCVCVSVPACVSMSVCASYILKTDQMYLLKYLRIKAEILVGKTIDGFVKNDNLELWLLLYINSITKPDITQWHVNHFQSTIE